MSPGGQPHHIVSDEVEDILALAAAPVLGPSTLAAFQSAIQDYWRQDDQHGGAVLRPAVMGQLRYVLDLLHKVPSGQMRNNLFSVAAELARLIGWTHFDACEYSQARLYFKHALELAKEVDDRVFMANVLACLSLQSTYEDRPSEGLALAAAAQDQARFAGTPKVMAILHMREAFAQAAMGDRSATHRAIGEAHRQFEMTADGLDEPAWAAYFNEVKLVVDTGIAHGRLGEPAVAEPLVSRGLREGEAHNRRGRAFHTFWLARIQLDRGALDQACDTGAEALEPASGVESARVQGHMQEFHAMLHPHLKERVVADFTSRLRDLLPGAVSGSPHR